MGVKHSVVVVGTTPVLLNSAEQPGDSSQTIRIGLESGTIYLGASNVSSTVFGCKVTTTTPVQFDLGAFDLLYAVSTVNTNVNVLYIGA
jgi:hypothetical protein